MNEPLTPWQRAETALALLATDPAGVKGLWIRARAGPVRDRVTDALPASRRIHPGIDDTALFGGVDLSATLAGGHLVQTRGLLSQPAPVTLTMAERCPPGLSARLARWLDDPGPCLIALDECADPDESLPPALADRLGLFLDLGDLLWSDTGPITLDPARITQARARLPQTALPNTALASLTTVADALGIASLRAPLLAIAAARALAAWRGEPVASEDTLRHAAELALAHRGDLPFEPGEQAPRPPPPDPDEAETEQAQPEQNRLPDEVLLEAGFHAFAKQKAIG